MANMSLNCIVTGVLDRPLRLLVYGTNGVGKSSMAANAPSSIFLCAEDGTAHLDVARFPSPENWDDVITAMRELYQQQHEFKTLVIDSLDWVESIAREAVCIDTKVESVEAIPYGKGWVFVQEKMSQLLKCCDALYGKGMNIFLIAHAQIKPFNDPEHPSYDRYSLKLDKRSEPMFKEWADYVLFCNFDNRVEQKTDNKGKPLLGVDGKAKAKSFGKRLLFSQYSAAYDAKKRFNIPDRLPLDWNTFYAEHQAAAKLNQTTQPITTQQTDKP